MPQANAPGDPEDNNGIKITLMAVGFGVVGGLLFALVNKLLSDRGGFIRRLNTVRGAMQLLRSAHRRRMVTRLRQVIRSQRSIGRVRRSFSHNVWLLGLLTNLRRTPLQVPRLSLLAEGSLQRLSSRLLKVYFRLGQSVGGLPDCGLYLVYSGSIQVRAWPPAAFHPTLSLLRRPPAMLQVTVHWAGGYRKPARSEVFVVGAGSFFGRLLCSGEGWPYGQRLLMLLHVNRPDGLAAVRGRLHHRRRCVGPFQGCLELPQAIHPWSS